MPLNSLAPGSVYQEVVPDRPGVLQQVIVEITEGAAAVGGFSGALAVDLGGEGARRTRRRSRGGGDGMDGTDGNGGGNGEGEDGGGEEEEAGGSDADDEDDGAAEPLFGAHSSRRSLV